MKQIQKRECLKCGHIWQPNIENPISCPKCKTYSYWIRPRKEINVEGGKTAKTKSETPNLLDDVVRRLE